MDLSRLERETVIRCNDLEKEWDVVTAMPSVIRYLERMGYGRSADRQLGLPYVAFRVPHGRVRFLRKEKRKVGSGGFARKANGSDFHGGERVLGE